MGLSHGSVLSTNWIACACPKCLISRSGKASNRAFDASCRTGFLSEIVFPRWLRDVTPSERAMARVRLGEVRKQFDSGPWSRVYLESSVRSSETGGDPGLNRRISITMPFLGRMIRNEKPILSFEREVYAGSHA